MRRVHKHTLVGRRRSRNYLNFWMPPSADSCCRTHTLDRCIADRFFTTLNTRRSHVRSKFCISSFVGPFQSVIRMFVGESKMFATQNQQKRLLQNRLHIVDLSYFMTKRDQWVSFVMNSIVVTRQNVGAKRRYLYDSFDKRLPLLLLFALHVSL